MIAALPMYDRPEVRVDTDALWTGIRDGLRDRGVAAPDALTRGMELREVWEAGDLVFAQTCGLPYRAWLVDQVALIGAPIHRDGPAGMYHSVIISRAEPLPDRPRLAVNGADSQSGWANLIQWLGETARPYGPVKVTGAHLASAKAVWKGLADLAAIDAVSWELMLRYDDWAADLRVIDHTPPVPALPYIAPRDADIALYRAALAEAVDALPATARASLNLYGIEPLQKESYTVLDLPPRIPL